MDKQKRCSCCRRMLELDEYPWDRGKRYATCRACKALYVKHYYDLHHDRIQHERAQRKLARTAT